MRLAERRARPLARRPRPAPHALLRDGARALRRAPAEEARPAIVAPAQPREGQGERAGCGRACDAGEAGGREGRRAEDAVDLGDGLHGRLAGVEGGLDFAAESQAGQ